MNWTDWLLIGSTLLSGYLGYAGTGRSAEISAEGSERAYDIIMEMYEQSREDIVPWREAGVNALESLQKMLEAGPGEYKASDEYNIRVAEGEKAINRALASRGLYDSGKALKALTAFNQDEAAKDYQAWFDNWLKSLTPYQSMAELGQTMVGQGVLSNAATGNALANISQNAANAAAGYKSDQYTNAGNAINTVVDEVLTSGALNNLFNGGSNGLSSTGKNALLASAGETVPLLSGAGAESSYAPLLASTGETVSGAGASAGGSTLGTIGFGAGLLSIPAIVGMLASGKSFGDLLGGTMDMPNLTPEQQEELATTGKITKGTLPLPEGYQLSQSQQVAIYGGYYDDDGNWVQAT